MKGCGRLTACRWPGSTPPSASSPGREREPRAATGQKSDVVTLYQGGGYCLYRYRTCTAVRLVFAPEFDIAFFGGAPDNFEYPRYALAVCFFRVYEGGKPARPEHF